ncbi:hypothetical protein [Pedobacter sp. NJ-S-72]
MIGSLKSYAMPVRCIRDQPVITPPSVDYVVIPAAKINSATAVGNANIVLDNGAPVTARGFVWNTTGSPDLKDNVIQDGTGLGAVTGTLSNLVEGPTYYVRAFATNSAGTGYSATDASFKICLPFTVTHKAGLKGAAVDKTITYSTVNTNLSGAAKCWITQNLGADRQATAVNDATEASAGWYWQFNRLQGYKMDGGAVRTPNAVWLPPFSENMDWLPENDPCTQLLGGKWRLPTLAEWNAAYGTPQNWASTTDVFNSEVKIHPAGYFNGATLTSRGALDVYWSGTQNKKTWYMVIISMEQQRQQMIKPGLCLSVRCLKD